MRPIVIGIAAASLAVSVVHTQSVRYVVQDLGPLKGGTFSQAAAVISPGIVAGVSSNDSGAQRAALWIKGRPFDIAGKGLGGPNSGAFGVTLWGGASIQAETPTADPYGEDFCGYGTHLSCGAARWVLGELTSLKTLGGNNATVGNINSLGQIPGVAETSTIDATCTIPFQTLQFKPVIWDSGSRKPRTLPLLRGDSVGFAEFINDQGQAVGFSGSCGNSQLPPIAFGPHAVVWDRDGSVHDLGNLGTSVLNMALGINNRGQVVGISSLANDSAPLFKADAFLWSRGTGMKDLGTLRGDVGSVATSLNDAGEVVGTSGDAAGNIRAFHWDSGTRMEDLNMLVPPDSPLQLLFAGAIDANGAIAGWGVRKDTGEVHGFLAIPVRNQTRGR